jgi:nicotinamidase-related amidase
VVHVQNDGGPDDPDQPFTPGWELVFEPHEPEEVIRKDVCDTFTADPGLAERLRAAGVDTVVVAGMQSEFCIQDTAFGAVRQGFCVVLPHDGHATYDGRDRDASAVSEEVEQRLRQAGVFVQPAAGVGFASATHRLQ